jgi:hypothetical protein
MPNDTLQLFLALANCGLCYIICGGMTSLNEYEAKLAELKQEQSRLRADKCKAAQRQRRSSGQTHIARLLHDAGSANVPPKLSKQVVSELVLLLDLSGFYDTELRSSAVDVVTSYALGQGRAQRFGSHLFSDVWDSSTRANIAAGVELLYIHTDDAQLTPGEYNASDSQLIKLCKYTVEFRLFSWLLEQNCKKGVLPGSSNLLAKASELIPATVPEHLRLRLRTYFLNTESTTSRHWVESYKARWGVEAARSHTGEDVEPKLRDRKVACTCIFRLFYFWKGRCLFVFWEDFWGPLLGPQSGPRMVALGNRFLRKRIKEQTTESPFLIPFVGSCFWEFVCNILPN